jgi:hypothetical protein
LYGDYVENISHAETTFRRVFEENSKLRNAIVTFHKEFKQSHSHAQMSSSAGSNTATGTSSTTINSNNSSPEGKLDRASSSLLAANSSASSAGSGSSGGLIGVFSDGEREQKEASTARRSKAQTKDDIAGEAIEFVVKYLRLPKTRIHYYTGIFTVCS